MPTYEYMCESCGHEFEQFQSITAGSLRKCPKCGKNALKRLIGSGAGIIFKGSGFYQTDYRSESYKKAEKDAKGKPAADKGEQKAKGTAETKTESTPAEKSKPVSSEKKRTA